MARARPQDQVTKKAKAKRAGSASTSRRSPSPKRDYPRGTCTVTRPSQASPRKAEHTVTPAQDLEAFKADMTSMLSDMLPFKSLPPSLIPILEAREMIQKRTLFLNRFSLSPQ